MSQNLFSKNVQRVKIVFLVIILILLLLVAIFFGYGAITSNSNKILRGVYVNSVNVGNMTPDEAQTAIRNKQATIENNTYVLIYENEEISVTGKELGLRYPTSVLSEATMYGKNGNIIENTITAFKSFFTTQEYNVDLIIDEDSLNDKIDIFLAEVDATSQDDYYEISGDKIIITKGHDGVVVNIEDVKNTILTNTNEGQASVNVPLKIQRHKAKRIDFDDLYDESCIEKKDAIYEEKDDGDMEFEQEIVGRTFDKDAAESEYLNLADDETMEIEFIKETPDVTTESLDSVLFTDVLSTFETTYAASNVNRSTNLEIAARNINGKILVPNEVFSYNKEVGERTAANGFKEAHVFAGGKVVDGLGGGICQISSTLYNAVLMSNLEIVERKNHMMYPEYVKPSLDATVVWGSIDFKFKNNRETPIKIEAYAKDGIAKVTIYGKKLENEPIVELESVILQTIPYTTATEYDDTMPEGTEKVTQSPVNGYVSKAYKILKDKDGNEISKTQISSDSYKATSKIVTVGTMKTDNPPTETTPAETTSSVETSPTSTETTPQQTTSSQQTTTQTTTQKTTPKQTTTQKTTPKQTTTPSTPQPSTPTPPPVEDLPEGWDTPENPNF